MKKTSIIMSLVLMMGLFACQKDESKELKARLLKEIPGITKIDSVKKTDINGLYEVAVGRKIFYVTDGGKYVIFGNVIELATKTNITEKRMEDLSVVDFSKLPLDLAVKVVIGDGSAKLVVFTDPNCPYCQMFEQKIASQLQNVTIYSFMIPLPSHPQSATDVKKIWCAKDRAAVWVAWMRSKVALPADMSCDTKPLDQVLELANNVVKIEGTPTIILEDGHMLQGGMAPEQLNQKLKEVHEKLTHATVK